MFAYSGTKFTDHRWSFEEWPAIKSTMVNGQAPVLEVKKDGKTYNLSQSRAIIHYLAREFGLAGKTNCEEFRANEVMEVLIDLMEAMAKTFFEKDEERKKQLMETVKNQTLPNKLGFIE